MAVSAPESLRFLDFPAEVRLAIYHYLIPNIPIRNFNLIRGRSKAIPLRRDGGRCCPAILRTCRLIYNEVVPEWYGSTQYEVVLDTKYILFCGRIIPPYAPVPSTVRYVHSMKLCISIQGTPQYIHSHSTVEHLLGFQDRIAVLARLLSDRASCRLQHLCVEIGVNIPLLLSLCKTPTGMLELLGWNLGPLRCHGVESNRSTCYCTAIYHSVAQARSLAMRILCLITIQLSICVACGLSSPLKDDEAPIPPNKDPFYTPPAGYQHAKPGTILSHREVPYPVANLGADDKPSHAYQILYRTNDSFGRATATVTTVLVPENANGTKLLSYQLAMDSSAIRCAPSYTIQKHLKEDILMDQMSKLQLLLSTEALAKGWVVAMPDFEGPNAAYMANIKAGYATLDGIRAVLSSTSFTGVSSSAAIAMWGYSGGSLATGLAAELQPLYAPELHISGIALGGTVWRTPTIPNRLNKKASAGLLVAAMHGLGNEYHEIALLIREGLVDDAKKREKFMKARHQCLLEYLVEFAYNDVFSYFKDPQLPNHPLLRKIEAANDMGKHTPKMPLLIYKGSLDADSPLNDTEVLVSQYCADGATVDLREVTTHDHFILGVDGFLEAIPWLEDRLDGVPVEHKCKKSRSAVPLSDSGSLETLLGTVREDLGDILGTILNL
ncbi:secretory lipase-domain-containing protein [Aspergillus floccosus]